MKHQNYIICYDICDEKRLQKVAKILEKVAYRIQYSIYLWLDPSTQEREKVIAQIQEQIDTNVDDVRLYTIKSNGYHQGIASNLDAPFLLI